MRAPAAAGVPPAQDRRIWWLGALALAALIAVGYFPATGAGFVWDDFIIATSQSVQDDGGLARFWLSPRSAFHPDDTDEDHYWPLLYTTFWLEHKLWGFDPLGYHIVNLLLHLANTLLVWGLLRRFAVPGAWIAAALFAVHPVHVEAVAWLIARKDVLSGFFYLAAACVYVRFVQTPGPWRYALALLLYAAALLSKSIAASLPAALLVWHWWKSGRVTVRDLLHLAPFFAVGLGIGIADIVFVGSRKVVSYGYEPVERVLIAAQALWFYIGKLLWPANLATIYPRWEIDTGDLLGWCAVAAAAAVPAALFVLRRRIGRGPLAGALYIALTLAPVLGFIDISWMQFNFAADRYQYLAMIGPVAVLSAAAVQLARRVPWGERVGGAAVAVLLAVLCAVSWRQAGVYKDELTFFRHIVAINPHERAVRLHLGKALAESGGDAARIAEAEQQYRLALEIDPNYQQGLQNLAELLRHQGRHEEAVGWYRRTLEADPRYVFGYAGLGLSLLELERREEGIEALARVLELKPNIPEAHPLLTIMGGAAEHLGRLDEAAGYYERALVLVAGDLATRERLARLQFARQRFEEALHAFRILASARPDDPAAHANVGAALYHLGRAEEAVRSFDRALALDPNYAAARASREAALQLLRDAPQAQ